MVALMDEIVGADPETPGVFGTRFLKTGSDHLPRQALDTRLKGREQKAFPHAGNITTELKAKAMWEKTFVLWSSDNGGASHLHGGANNYPLKGGYMNNWEGGIRVAALVNGGLLPEDVRGKTLEGFIHEADW